MKLSAKINLPVFSIYSIIISILLTPFAMMGTLEIMQVVSLFIIILNIKYLILAFRKNILFHVFFFYTLFYFLILLVIKQEDFVKLFLKQLIFFSSFYCFILLLSFENYFREHTDKLVRIINVVLIITCVYGIYQGIGRVMGLPFTGDEFLRFRPFKIAGMYQVSSFFAEPAFYIQFLISSFVIHVFFLNLEYKKIILLIVVNVVITISLSGYATLFLLSILWLIISVFQNLYYLKFKKSLLVVSVIFVALFIVVINLDIFKFTFQRFSTLMKINSVVENKSSKSEHSGNMRLFGEIETIKKVINSDHSVFGYGLTYMDYFPKRKMSLNAFTEVLMRWGIIGIGLFLLAFLIEIFNNRRTFLILSVFLLLYFTIDGAIAKASFWMFIGLVFLFSRVYNFKHDMKGITSN